MTVRAEIPDQIVRAMAPEDGDVACTVLGAMALDSYRTDRLTEYESDAILLAQEMQSD